VRSKINNKFYALKKIRATKNSTRKKAFSKGKRELSLHLKCNQHPNIIKLVQASQKGEKLRKKLSLLLEFAENGCLFNYIKVFN